MSSDDLSIQFSTVYPCDVDANIAAGVCPSGACDVSDWERVKSIAWVKILLNIFNGIMMLGLIVAMSVVWFMTKHWSFAVIAAVLAVMLLVYRHSISRAAFRLRYAENMLEKAAANSDSAEAPSPPVPKVVVTVSNGRVDTVWGLCYMRVCYLDEVKAGKPFVLDDDWLKDHNLKVFVDGQYHNLSKMNEGGDKQ